MANDSPDRFVSFFGRLILPMIIVAFAECSPSQAGESNSEGFWVRTKNAVVRSASRLAISELKRECRDCVEDWVGEEKPKYGLALLDRVDPRSELVVFIHGFNSRPEDMSALIQDAQDQNLACATFRYPNDQAIRDSALSLSTALLDLKRHYPRLKVSLVTHSMGGLVARSAVENAGLDPGNVTRLIMLMPPNHGTNLARIAFGADLLEFAVDENRRREGGLVLGSILDGLSEATSDLKPGSEFLKELNACNRNPRIRYSLFIGNQAAIDDQHVEQLQICLKQTGKKCSWFQCASKTVDSAVGNLPELVSGSGDGVVSIESARLPGVADIIEVDFHHNQILDSQPSAEVQRVRNSIIWRLMAS